MKLAVCSLVGFMKDIFYLSFLPIIVTMITIWTSEEKKDDKIIAFGNNTIYRGNAKVTDTDAIARDLKSGHISGKLFEIPLRYLTEVRLEESKDHIRVFYGKEGEEDLRITDKKKRNEIFEFFRSGIPNTEYKVEKFGPLKAGKKPMIAFGVVLIIFLVTLFFAIRGESGEIYYVENGRYDSLTGIIIALASIGVTKVIILFSSLMAIAVISFIIKAKNAPVMNRIIVKGYPT